MRSISFSWFSCSPRSPRSFTPGWPWWRSPPRPHRQPPTRRAARRHDLQGGSEHLAPAGRKQPPAPSGAQREQRRGVLRSATSRSRSSSSGSQAPDIVERSQHLVGVVTRPASRCAPASNQNQATVAAPPTDRTASEPASRCGRVRPLLRPTRGRPPLRRPANTDNSFVRPTPVFAPLGTCSGAKSRGFRSRCNQWRRRELNPRPQSRER